VRAVEVAAAQIIERAHLAVEDVVARNVDRL
jgi:hypothetical protein